MLSFIIYIYITKFSKKIKQGINLALNFIAPLFCYGFCYTRKGFTTRFGGSWIIPRKNFPILVFYIPRVA